MISPLHPSGSKKTFSLLIAEKVNVGRKMAWCGDRNILHTLARTFVKIRTDRFFLDSGESRHFSSGVTVSSPPSNADHGGTFQTQPIARIRSILTIRLTMARYGSR